MNTHDIKIEILKTGEVRAEISGVKGPACMKYAQLLEEIVGKETARELTSEYYEPGGEVVLNDRAEQHEHRG